MTERSAGRRPALLFLVCSLSQLAAAGRCTSPSRVPGACTRPEDSRVVEEADLLVGRTAGDGCENVGGSAFAVAPGRLSAVATWTDPNAVLKLEVWSEGFQRLLAAGTSTSGQRCAGALTNVVATTVVVRVCHMPESRVAVADRDDARTFTRYHLVLAQ